MSERQPIETCPLDEDVLLYFPDFKCWTLGQQRVSEGWGLPLVEWVDQWNGDEFELSNSMIRPQPSHWAPLPDHPE